MKSYHRIKDLREDKDLTQDELSKMLNMHRTQYGRYENALSTIPLEFIEKLAEFYEVSIDYIAGLTNDKGGLHKINNDEKKIIDVYNNLSEKSKGKLELFAEQLTKKEQMEKP